MTARGWETGECGSGKVLAGRLLRPLDRGVAAPLDVESGALGRPLHRHGWPVPMLRTSHAFDPPLNFSKSSGGSLVGQSLKPLLGADFSTA